MSKQWYNHENMLKLKTSPNHSKLLILGSGDSFSSNFNIFEKTKNSDCLMLQVVTWKFSEMCLISAQVNFFSFWHYILIDNHWIDHSYQFWPPNPYMRHASKTSYVLTIYKKTINCKNSQKVSSGSYKGPLQIPIDIGPMSLTLHAVNGQFVFQLENGQLLQWA